MDDLLNYRDAAKAIGISEAALRRLVRNRGIPHIRIGARVLFSPQDIERFVATRRQETR